MKFFFDNCISPKLAKAMDALLQPKHEVVHLRDKWPQAHSETIKDVVWIQTLASEGDWIVLSGDIHIRSRPGEREALRISKLTTFFLADGYPKLDRWEQVRWMIDQWPEIEALAERMARGSVLRVPKRGKIQTF